MKQTIVLIMITGILALINSCAKHPFACFTTEPDENSIHRMQPVTFNAACSTNGDGFFWELYGNEDSTFYGQTLTTVFKDSGNVKVFLLITAGGRTASTERYIKVLP
ncbi:MAG: hypothetical protein U0T75_06110 [Chitinophagales bacterium]